MIVYELVIEDMTTLGAMGTSPTVESRKLYASVNLAQLNAKMHYGNEIEWERVSRSPERGTYWTSGDLRYVMYTINEIHVID